MAPTPDDLDPLFSTGQLMKFLGHGRTKTMQLIRTGRLACVRDGKRFLVRRSTAQAYVASLPAGYVRGKAVRS